MTEQLLTQQLESPSGTGRVEPRSPQPAPHPSTEMGCSLWTNPFSLGNLGVLTALAGASAPSLAGARMRPHERGSHSRAAMTAEYGGGRAA